MSNSSLVQYKRLIGNYSSRQGNKIDRIVIHHTAGVMSLETLGNVFLSREGSATYGIGSDGRIGQYVDESNRPWTTSSWEIDKRAVTIEVSNSENGGSWPVSDYVLRRLIELVADICKRNGINKLYFDGTIAGSNLHMHKWYAATACPGPYLGAKFPYIVEQVNKKLAASDTPAAVTDVLYRVQVGAFKEKANAQALENKLKADGYGTYLVNVNGLYKVQTGAFKIRSNADNTAAILKASGYAVYVTTAANVPASESFSVGDQVVPVNLVSTSGVKLTQYDNVYYISEISGDKAVLQAQRQSKRITWAEMFLKDIKRA